MTTCQKCGGEVQGWLCQGCGQAFREADGKLVFDHAARTTFDGWVLVQREPTVAMVDAGYQAMFNHDNVVDIYASMLAAAPPVDGWQPIETHDGSNSYVLIAEPTGFVCMARLLDDGQGWWERNNDPTDHWGGECDPTHWMPLPQPPNNERTPG